MFFTASSYEISEAFAASRTESVVMWRSSPWLSFGLPHPQSRHMVLTSSFTVRARIAHPSRRRNCRLHAMTATATVVFVGRDTIGWVELSRDKALDLERAQRCRVGA